MEILALEHKFVEGQALTVFETSHVVVSYVVVVVWQDGGTSNDCDINKANPTFETDTAAQTNIS